jgi:hypothetical protein
LNKSLLHLPACCVWPGTADTTPKESGSADKEICWSSKGGDSSGEGGDAVS